MQAHSDTNEKHLSHGRWFPYTLISVLNVPITIFFLYIALSSYSSTLILSEYQGSAIFLTSLATCLTYSLPFSYTCQCTLSFSAFHCFLSPPLSTSKPPLIHFIFWFPYFCLPHSSDSSSLDLTEKFLEQRLENILRKRCDILSTVFFNDIFNCRISTLYRIRHSHHYPIFQIHLS